VVPIVALGSNILVHLHSISNSLHDCIKLSSCQHGCRRIWTMALISVKIDNGGGLILLHISGGCSTCITNSYVQFLINQADLWDG